MSFRRVAAKEELWSGEMICREIAGEPVVLINIENQIYAYADVCPHQRSRLSEGTLTEKTLRCARHQWEFEVCTGTGINPRNTCLKMFPVRLEGEDILIDVSDSTS
jgi:toluene monooxygenase system ferredoxin subunit